MKEFHHKLTAQPALLALISALGLAVPFNTKVVYLWIDFAFPQNHILLQVDLTRDLTIITKKINKGVRTK